MNRNRPPPPPRLLRPQRPPQRRVEVDLRPTRSRQKPSPLPPMNRLRRQTPRRRRTRPPPPMPDQRQHHPQHHPQHHRQRQRLPLRGAVVPGWSHNCRPGIERLEFPPRRGEGVGKKRVQISVDHQSTTAPVTGDQNSRLVSPFESFVLLTFCFLAGRADRRRRDSEPVGPRRDRRRAQTRMIHHERPGAGDPQPKAARTGMAK